MEIKLTLNEDETRKLSFLLDYWADTVCDFDSDIDEKLPTTELCEYIVNQLDAQVPPETLENPEVVQ